METELGRASAKFRSVKAQASEDGDREEFLPTKAQGRSSGWIVSTLLAVATVGSFTGGALTDKFCRTRTFQLDAIPLAVGAYLCATAQSVQTMITGRILAGIGIGISSAIVPLYISEVEDNVWHCYSTFCFIGCRDDVVPRKSSMALSGFPTKQLNNKKFN